MRCGANLVVTVLLLMSMAAAGGAPDWIVQWGRPRTGTTLQFQTLCVLHALTHEEDADTVTCSVGTVPKDDSKGRYSTAHEHALHACICPVILMHSAMNDAHASVSMLLAPLRANTVHTNLELSPLSQVPCVQDP